MPARSHLGVLLTAVCWLAGCSLEPPPSATSNSQIRKIQLPFPGTEQVQNLPSHEIHEVEISLDAGEALSLDAVQQGVDLVLEVAQPDGKLLKIDSPIEDHGAEHVCLVAPSGGLFTVRISSLDATETGRYALRASGVRKAGQREQRCLQATTAFSELEHANPQPPIDRLTAEQVSLAETFEEIDHPFQAAVVYLAIAFKLENQGLLLQQLESYRKALEPMRKAGDRLREATILIQMGRVLRVLGKPEQARSLYDQALVISEQLGDKRTKAYIFNNLARLQRELGHWHEALANYEEALKILRNLGEEQSAAVALNNLGFCLTALRRYREGLDRLTEARQILDRLTSQSPNPRAEATLANVWLNIGRIYFFQERYDRAVESYEHALKIEPSATDMPKTLQYLAGGYCAEGRYSESEKTFHRALELAQATGSASQYIKAKVGLSSLYRVSGRPEAAVEQLEEVHASILELNDPETLAEAYSVWAEAERDLGRLDQARRMFERGFKQIFSLRSTAWAQGEQLRPSSTWQTFLESYVDLLLEMHRHAPERGFDRMAFQLADSERGRLFYQNLLASKIQPRFGASSELLAREQDVQERLKARSERRDALIASQANAAELADIEIELRDLGLEYDRLQAEILSSNPRFAELRNPRPMGLREVQDALDDDTLLLRFFVGRKSSVVFHVERSNFSSRMLPAGNEIEELAQSIYKGWSSPQRRLIIPTRRKARELSRLLLAGIEEHSPAKKRLIIVADGMLHYLPFATLPLPDSIGLETEDEIEELLVDRFELAQLPLAAALPDLRSREAARQPAPHLLAVIADPVFSADDPRVSPRQNRQPPIAQGLQRGFSLPAVVQAADSPPRLPASRQEAESILKLSPTDGNLLALDFDAQASLFTDTLANYRIVHIATHAVIEEEYPELYRIVLSQVTDTGEVLPGSVALHEIYNIDLPADLVVLSGCQTALGERVRGEGLVGWTRGFFTAGASRLLVSLWDIDDQATAEFMTEFYRGLFKRSLSPATALRQAQNHMRASDRWEHPYYWSGFVLQGDWKPISFGTHPFRLEK